MKYLGSKARIANDILPIMLNGMKAGDTFVDAFCGGCNLLDKVPDMFHRTGNDKNKYLIAMWVRLTYYGWNPPTEIDRGVYNIYRQSFNQKKFDEDTSISAWDAEVGWYGFMGSFNGRFFDGGYSGHDVNGRDYIGEQIRNTLAQVPKLKGVDWYYSDYDKIPLPEHSTIYCDIPYKDTKQYSTSKNFVYERFYDWCRHMKDNGHRIFVSEYQMPDDFKCIWEKQITNAMNQKNTYKPTERLFTL